MDLVLLILNFVLVVGAAYYVTKKVAQLSNKGKKESRMELMDTLHLGPAHSVHIIKVGTEYHMIGKTKDRLEHFGLVEGEEQVDGRITE